MFCPNCRSEYRSGFTQCGHCKVPLVASLAEATTLDEAGVAAYFKGRNTVMVTQGALAMVREVHDVLASNGCVSRMVPMDDDSGGVHNMFKLEIIQEDLDKARAISGNRWKEMVAREVGAPVEAREAVLAAGQETECPACGHKFIPADTATAECPECGLFLGVPG